MPGWRHGGPAGAYDRPVNAETSFDGPAIADRLAHRLDVPVDGMAAPAMVAVGLGLRARNLYRSIRHAGAADAIAAAAVVRALVEVGILIGWIEIDPVPRIRMWLAEDDRNRLIVADRTVELHGRRGRSLTPVFSDGDRATMRDAIAEARRLGESSGAPRRGSVMPSLEIMARAVPDLWELYEIAYRSLSPTTHTAPSSMAFDDFETRPDGVHLVTPPAYSIEAVSALAAGVICYVVESVSRQAGLDLEIEARDARLAVTRWPDPPAASEAGPSG